VSYFARDNAGNTSATQSQTVKIDTVAPSAPSLSVPAYVNSANVAAVPVTGTAEAGGTVRLTVTDNRGGSNAVTVTTTASGTGAWSLSPNLSTLNQGVVTYKATVTDAAGNTGTTTTTTATKDTIAPAAPTLTVPAYVNNANVAAVPVSGTAESGGTVALTVTDAGSAHTVTASTTVSGAGAWSFSTLNLSALNQGTLTYSATALDAAGNPGTATTASGTKDTVAPSAPTLTVPAYVTGPTGPTGSRASAVQLSGSSEAGASVVVTASDAGNAHTATGSVIASGAGTWSITLDLSSLNDGALTYSAAATDAAGNTGTSAIATGQKDVVSPTVTGLALANGTGTGGNKSTAFTADKGDTLTIQYSEAMDPTKFCTGWNGTSLTGTVNINDAGTNDTLVVSGTNCSSLSIGAISLGGNYVGTAGATFQGNGNSASTLTWDATAKTLTIKLGTLSTGAPLTGVPAGSPSYTPAGGLSDLAGNPLGITTYQFTGTSGF
jgi:hypothetical protein